MAIYLGQNKVSPMFVKTIEKTVTINNGSTTTTYNTNTNFVQEDPDNLAKDLPVVNEWSRPAAWPNLDNLPALTEGVYLTYDNTQTDCQYASFICSMNTGSYIVALGHINGNTWVQDSTQTITGGNYCEVNFASSTYDYPIFRITPASTNHITAFYFGRVSAANLGTTTANRVCQDQYCLERRGKLSYLNTTAGSGTNYRYCTYYMQYDNTLIGENNTGNMNLSCAWYCARRLRKINFTSWPTSQWNVTSLVSTFDGCHSIEQLDLSCWDTANWHVTGISEMFRYCFRLKYLNVPFNTINWGDGAGKTMSFANAFNSCFSLEELDLSTWNVTNLNVTSLNQTWNNCSHLKKLNVSNWVTSNWVVTNLYCTWYYCPFLVNVDLSGWNTAAWKVTDFRYTWWANYRRRNFDDIKNWNTALWAPTSLQGTFDSCFTIQELDLRNWNTSNWKVTSLYSTWNGCRSMRSLKVGNWNTSQWTVTTLYCTWQNCQNLEDTTFFNWNTTNWAVTNMSSTFYACHALKEIDITQWTGTSNWALTTIAYLAGYSKQLRKLNISTLNLSNVVLNNYGSNNTTYTIVYDCYNLQELKLPATFAGHLNIRYNYCFSRTELVRIFNALPTALSGAKIILTDIKYKLTTADIAIATNKGYTVS